MTRGISRHISSVVTWKHILVFHGETTGRHSTVCDAACFSEAYRVQVQDDFPRLRLHPLYDLVGLDAVRRQTEAAQQTHLHDRHTRRVQTQTLRQTARYKDVRKLYSIGPKYTRIWNILFISYKEFIFV